jgi:hypothetical protein
LIFKETVQGPEILPVKEMKTQELKGEGTVGEEKPMENREKAKDPTRVEIDAFIDKAQEKNNEMEIAKKEYFADKLLIKKYKQGTFKRRPRDLGGKSKSVDNAVTKKRCIDDMEIDVDTEFAKKSRFEPESKKVKEVGKGDEGVDKQGARITRESAGLHGQPGESK